MAVAFCAGCKPQQPYYFHEKDDMSHYVGLATEIDYPDLKDQPPSEVECAIRPFSLANPQPKEIWDLKLEDAVRITLQNSKVMRSIGGQVVGPPTFITQNPAAAATIYDPAVTETDPRFGVEAALSLFDAQWNTDISVGKNLQPENNATTQSGLPTSLPIELDQDTASFGTELRKTTATGGVLSVSSTSVYDFERFNALRRVPGDWTTALHAQIDQPLLQGAGVEFNRIAGPGAIPGFNQGVVIARLNTDIALANFESSVRNLLSDVEIAYWELYFAYRNLDTAVAGRDGALKTWQRVYALFKAGPKGGDKASEAQAREQYFLFRSTAEQALANLYQTESKLRYMMGLAATDGRLIRPADEPTTAKITFDWCGAQSEALCRGVEIREQKWRVKQREMELIAAKNYMLPRLDAVAGYTLMGMGQQLADGGNDINDANGFPNGAFENMGSGQYPSWSLGLTMQVPLGFRKQLSGVRNAELALSRERAKLRETELEVSHQVAYAIRDLEGDLVLTQTNFNRRVAAQRNVEAVNAAYETGTVAIDVLLQAQRQLATAESDYYRSLVNYVKSISQVHYRKGSLLEYNGVCLAEGPWPGKAYFDARRRARARDAATYMDYGFTLPKAVSRGPYIQHSGDPAGAEEAQAASTDKNPAKPEEVPLPPAGQPVPSTLDSGPSHERLADPPPAATDRPAANGNGL
jgi:outer membrane protein TolC